MVSIENDLSLNIYSAKFRNLDPAIGRWWQIDLKVEEYTGWPVYHAMANNPVRVADPNGDRWLRPADQQQGEKLIRKIDSKITKLAAKTEKYEGKMNRAREAGKVDKAQKFQAKIASNNERVGEMTTSRTQIQAMGNHAATFAFEKVQGNIGSIITKLFIRPR